MNAVIQEWNHRRECGFAEWIYWQFHVLPFGWSFSFVPKSWTLGSEEKEG